VFEEFVVPAEPEPDPNPGRTLPLLSLGGGGGFGGGVPVFGGGFWANALNANTLAIPTGIILRKILRELS
jgi:hypothetical protein